MDRKGLSQEGLKVIACTAMLLDHIGATFCSGMGLRVIGRLAFPIYCFLLVEGAARTRSPKKYALRLAISALVSELPFDLLFYGDITWAHQSVMVTLLLGFFMIVRMARAATAGEKALSAVLFAAAAELLGTDYGGHGILIMALFAVTREWQRKIWLQILGQAALWWLMGGYRIVLGAVRIPIQLFAVFSMVPITCYSGTKAFRSRAVQWAFYLFYPAHMSILLFLK